MAACAACCEPIKHDDGWCCESCNVVEHESCAEDTWRRDSDGSRFCEGCCVDVDSILAAVRPRDGRR